MVTGMFPIDDAPISTDGLPPLTAFAVNRVSCILRRLIGNPTDMPSLSNILFATDVMLSVDITGTPPGFGILSGGMNILEKKKNV